MSSEGGLSGNQRASIWSDVGSSGSQENPHGVGTGIVCTIGPKTNNVASLTALLRAGMSVARLNFSHGDHAYHASVITNVRAAAKELPGRLAAIMLDTKGPEIRSGKLAGGASSIELTAGDTFVWHNDPSRKEEGTTTSGYCTYPHLATTLSPGARILAADALLSFTVLEVDKEQNQVTCRVDNGGSLGNTKNMNLPNQVTNLPAMTEKDSKDIAFGVEQNVDMIAASFIRKAEDVRVIRSCPGVAEKGIAIVSKIENQEGLDNFDEILAESDGIMVARGDLGSEIPIENVFAAQKMMISKCNKAGKPVITATQMLDSMITNPRPTRAEATDVANAVLDGTDCVMLSGETANGSWPTEAVQTMARICRAAESSLDTRMLYQQLVKEQLPPVPLPEAMASSAVKASYDLRAPLIVVVTTTGRTARLISKYRPSCPILTITDVAKTAHTVILSRGTIPFRARRIHGTEEISMRAISKAMEVGLCKPGDWVPVVFGRMEGVAGSINAMKIVRVLSEEEMHSKKAEEENKQYERQL